MSQSLSSSVIRVLIANILVRSGMIVMQLFLNVFVWKYTQDLKIVALYNIILIICHTLTYTFCGSRIKSGYRKIAHVISLVGYGSIYCILMWYSGSVIEYVYRIAGGIGCVNGLYRLTYHNTQFDLTTYENRGNFEGIKSALSIGSKLIFPALFGFIISQNYYGYGYEIVFGIGAFMFLLAGGIGAISPGTFSHTPFSIYVLWKKIKNSPDVIRSLVTGSTGAIGFSGILLDTLLPLLLFSFVGNEGDVGYFVSFFSLVSIVSSYFFGKFVPYGSYGKVLMGVGVIVSGLYIGLLLFPSYTGLVLISALLNFFLIFFSIPQKIISDNILHTIPGYASIRPEFVVVRERFLTVGWLTVYVIVYFAQDLDIIGLKYVFFLMIASVIISVVSLQKITLNNSSP